jgi:hypothetical protein
VRQIPKKLTVANTYQHLTTDSFLKIEGKHDVMFEALDLNTKFPRL